MSDSTVFSAEIIGVLNCSPDSFSDGAERDDEATRERMDELVADGADWLDVGGESTAPGSQAVDEATELARLGKFFRNAPLCGVPWSVDTMKHGVAREALRAGAKMVNDVSGGRADPAMLDLLSEHPDTAYVLMHSAYHAGRAERGPREEGDILDVVTRFFEERLSACERAGMRRESIILDPGMGAFLGPDPADSMRVIRHIADLRERFGLRIYVGASRKWFLSAYTLDHGPHDRVGGSLAASVAAALRWADFVRTHDVRLLRQFKEVWNAISSDEA